MTCACRCRRAACQARQSLPATPDWYKTPPVCRSCGKGELRIDKWRMAHERRQKTCECGGYSFPHRPGSGFCIYNPTADHEHRENYS